MRGARALLLAALACLPACRKAPPGAMRLVEAGEFWMGAPEREDAEDDHPRHRVFLGAYWLDERPVSTGEYRAFAQASGREAWEPPPGVRDGAPAVFVNWDDARAYCESVSKRLPTEAEWERAGLAVDHAEWMQDWYAPDAYLKGPAKDPKGPVSGTQRVFRGGLPSHPLESRRPWSRRRISPASRLDFLSFRCARDAIVY